MKNSLFLLVLTLLIFPTQVSAQGDSIKVSGDKATIVFPNSIEFKVNLESDTEISSVRLLYGTTQDTCGKVIAIAFPKIEPGKKVSASWEWDMRQSGGEPPGATIWWQWEVKDRTGNITLTEKQSTIWLDDIHSWRELDDGLIRLHYYMGDSAFGNTLRSAAVSSLERLSKDTGITPDQPIDIYIYGDSQDMRDAVLYEPGWTGGLAYSDYNIVIIGISPGDVDWGKRTVAHELTHVLVGDFTFSCLGAMPTWLVEGIAVYGEGGPESSGVSNFEKNKAADTLLTFRVLSGGFSEDPDQADLSYSQSYYMVKYLIDNHGKERLISLFEALKKGGELNGSLQDIYGFDLIGFENIWRKSLDLPPIEENALQATSTPTIIPTIIPIQGLEPAATITPQPTSIESVVTATPETALPQGIQELLSEGSMRTMLMILLGCTCVGGIIVVAIITVLIVRKTRSTKGGEVL